MQRVSSALVSVGVAAMAQQAHSSISSDIQVSSEFVDEELSGLVENMLASQNKRELSGMARALSEKLNDPALEIKLSFSFGTPEDQYEGDQSIEGDAEDGWQNSCYNNCHNACHSSRGWR